MEGFSSLKLRSSLYQRRTGQRAAKAQVQKYKAFSNVFLKALFHGARAGIESRAQDFA